MAKQHTEGPNARTEYMAYLRMKYEKWDRYHDHKESSAWVTTALYVGGAGYIAFSGDSLLDWHQNGIETVGSLLIIAAFVFAGCLVLWQLRKRRIANIQHDAWQELLDLELQRLLDDEESSAVNLEQQSKEMSNHHRLIWNGCIKDSEGKRRLHFAWGGVFVSAIVLAIGALVILRMVALIS